MFFPHNLSFYCFILFYSLLFCSLQPASKDHKPDLLKPLQWLYLLLRMFGKELKHTYLVYNIINKPFKGIFNTEKCQSGAFSASRASINAIFHHCIWPSEGNEYPL